MKVDINSAEKSHHRCHYKLEMNGDYLGDLSFTQSKKFSQADIIFLEAIKQSGKNVKHIHNPVYHLGLEPIHRYLPKQIEALTTLKQQVEAGNLAAKERPLHKAYLSLNQFYMTAIFQNLYSLFSKYIMANLNSASPSIRCFDLFKLYHYSKLYN